MRKKINVSIILALLLMLGFCATALAEPETFETEGIFMLGDNDTIAQAREFALQDAKREALEKAGTYLSSATQVVNGTVTNDEINVIASGVIKLEEIISEETVVDGSQISVHVKARFVIESDDLQNKIEHLKQSKNPQEELQEMADYSKAIEVDSTNAIEYYNRGNSYDDKGQYDLAIANYNKAIEIDPTFANAYYNRAIS
jgi:tetratricopeptide (TPR) repeat protein